jgi:hypothetical protein
MDSNPSPATGKQRMPVKIYSTVVPNVEGIEEQSIYLILQQFLCLPKHHALNFFRVKLPTLGKGFLISFSNIRAFSPTHFLDNLSEPVLRPEHVAIR